MRKSSGQLSHKLLPVPLTLNCSASCFDWIQNYEQAMDEQTISMKNESELICKQMSEYKIMVLNWTH